MKKFLVAGLMLVLAATGTQAATVNLTDSILGNPSADVITETAGGVTFTFTSVNNFVGAPRWLGGPTFSDGLHVGGGGGSPIEFTLSVSDDVTLTGYGTNQGGGFALNLPTFDILDGGATLLANQLINNPASTNISNLSGQNTVLVTGLSLALSAGTDYTFDINNIGAAVQGFITSFEFETDVAVVPVPASLPLMLTGIGVFAFLRRKRLS